MQDVQDQQIVGETGPGKEVGAGNGVTDSPVQGGARPTAQGSAGPARIDGVDLGVLADRTHECLAVRMEKIYAEWRAIEDQSRTDTTRLRSDVYKKLVRHGVFDMEDTRMPADTIQQRMGGTNVFYKTDNYTWRAARFREARSALRLSGGDGYSTEDIQIIVRWAISFVELLADIAKLDIATKEFHNAAARRRRAVDKFLAS